MVLRLFVIDRTGSRGKFKKGGNILGRAKF